MDKRIKNTYSFHYNINEDKGTVVCVAKVEKLDKRLYDMVYGADNFAGKTFYIRDLRDRVFVGKAVLKDNDVNDIEKAKKIARDKALRQANGVFSAVVWEFRQVFYNYLMDLEQIYAGTIIKRNEYAEKVYKATRK